MRDFLFAFTGVWTGNLWIYSPALYHYSTVTFGFHLLQFEVFNSGAEGSVVVFFWLDLWAIFFFPALVFELGTSGSLIPALYHYTMVTSGFHLWQFQVFNSGAKGMVLVLFWLDLWEIFFYTTPSLWTGDLWISFPALYHYTMVTSDFHLWQFQVFNSGAEGLVVVFFCLDLWEIFFYPTPSFELGASESLFLHSSTVPWWLLVFTCDNFKYLTLVLRDHWWYCSVWMCERFSFPQTWLWTWGPVDL